jgi:hypothetical protein
MAKKPALGAAPTRSTATMPDNTSQDRTVADDAHAKHLGAKVPSDIVKRYGRLALELEGKNVRALLIEAIDLLEAKYGKS